MLNVFLRSIFSIINKKDKIKTKLDVFIQFAELVVEYFGVKWNSYLAESN